eukprot:g680.t1
MQVDTETAKQTGCLHITGQGMSTIPSTIFELSNLWRLDLSGNCIQEVSSSVGNLSRLEELWLNENRYLQELPPEIEHCKQLRTLDLRNTNIRSLPFELGRLQKLNNILLDGIQLESKQDEAYRTGGTKNLLKYLKHRDVLRTLHRSMVQRLCEVLYREQSDTDSGVFMITQMVDAVFEEFQDVDEIKNLIRNAERLFPEQMEDFDAKSMRKQFVLLRRDNEKKKKAAELELKLRCIYFDRIKIESIEGIVKSIYQEITSLEDIVFLIKYAKLLFPPNPESIQGVQVKEELVALQEKLARERADAIEGIFVAFKTFYSSVEPEKLKDLAEKTAALFKKVEDLKKLAADAAELLPAEFEAATAKKIKAKFKKRKLESTAL